MPISNTHRLHLNSIGAHEFVLAIDRRAEVKMAHVQMLAAGAAQEVVQFVQVVDATAAWGLVDHMLEEYGTLPAGEQWFLEKIAGDAVESG